VSRGADPTGTVGRVPDAGTADTVAPGQGGASWTSRRPWNGRGRQPARRAREDRPTLSCYEGRILAEIGQVLGVTGSRVYQMHTKATLQLRAKLQDGR